MISLSHRKTIAGIYLLKVNSNTKTRFEIWSKSIVKAQERPHSGVFIVNFEHISCLVLVFLMLTLNKQMPAGFKIVIKMGFLSDRTVGKIITEFSLRLISNHFPLR